MSLQVRTSKLGVMGLAMNRFSNLPFQNWQIQPSADGDEKAELTLVGSAVVLTVTIGVSSTIKTLNEYKPKSEAL